MSDEVAEVWDAIRALQDMASTHEIDVAAVRDLAKQCERRLQRLEQDQRKLALLVTNILTGLASGGDFKLLENGQFALDLDLKSTP